ncbi:MAG: hypothetical protein HC877_06740 [Thioploca sp.]|nr:hypothetical protein [Thioploca sp.]
MKKAIYTVFIVGILAMLACSKEQQQETAQDMSHKAELEKAEQVQGIVDDKTAKDSQQATEESDE